MLSKKMSINRLMTKLGINHNDCGLPETEPAPSINHYCDDLLYLLADVIPAHSDLYNWVAAAIDRFDLIAWQHNENDLPIWRTSYMGTSILQIAAAQEKWDLLQTALQYEITDADLNQISTAEQDPGRTLLWYLVYYQQYELLTTVADKCQHLNDAVDQSALRGLTISTMLRLLPKPITLSLENNLATNTTPRRMQLVFATICGNIDFLQQTNADQLINTTVNLHQNLISQATIHNQLAVLRYLTETGSNATSIQHDQLTPALKLAIKHGHKAIVTYIFTKLSPAITTIEDVKLAASNRHLELFAELLPMHLTKILPPAEKSEFNKFTLIGHADSAIAAHYFQTLNDHLPTDKIANIAIEAAFHAVFTENLDLLKYLMTTFAMHPVKTSRKARSLVRCAVKNGSTNILHYLITTYNLTYQEHIHQESLLFKAIEMNQPSIAAYLINKYKEILYDKRTWYSPSSLTPFLSAARQHHDNMMLFLLEVDNKLICDTDSDGHGTIYHGCDTIYSDAVTDFVFTRMLSDPRCEAVIESDLRAIAFKRSASLTAAMSKAVTKLIQKIIRAGEIDKIKTIMRHGLGGLDHTRLEQFLITPFANGDIPLLFALRHQQFAIADIIHQKHHNLDGMELPALQKLITPTMMPQAKHVYPTATSISITIPNEYICPIMQSGALMFNATQVMHGTKEQQTAGKSFEKTNIKKWQRQNTPRWGQKKPVKCPVTSREIIDTQPDKALQKDIDKFIRDNQTEIAAKDITLPPTYIARFIGDVCNSGYIAKQYAAEPRLGYMFLTMIANKSALHMICENDQAAEFKLFLRSIPNNNAAHNILLDKEHENDLSLFDIAICFGSWQVLDCVFTDKDILELSTNIKTAIQDGCIYKKTYLSDSLAEQLDLAKQQKHATRTKILERYQEQLQPTPTKKCPPASADSKHKTKRTNIDSSSLFFSIPILSEDSSDSSLDAPDTPEHS